MGRLENLPAMSSGKRTSLYALHAELGARFVDFAGWEMPVQYRSILEEHKAVRTAVGLFDVSHMGELLVAGNGACALLDRLLTNDVSQLRVGRALYSMMCNEDGGVIDDLIVYRTSEDAYLLCLNASNTEADIAWIRKWGAASSFNGRLEDQSASTALLAVQGPAAAALLQPLCSGELAGMRAFDVRSAEVAGCPCLLARTGYTGEDGFEIFLPWNSAEEVARAMLAAGAVPCGLGARDSLRTEAGYPLHGHEISAQISPIAADLQWTVKFSKASDFVGRAALTREAAAGPAARVVWFRTGERRILRPDTPVLANGKPCGRVLSGTLSPGLGESIGSALVEGAGEGMLACEVRGTLVPLLVVAPPFIPLKKT